MEQSTEEFVKEKEDKLGGKLIYRSFAVWYGDDKGNRREYGAFVYSDGRMLGIEDFFRPSKILGYELKTKGEEKRRSEYKKMEIMLPLSDIKCIEKVSQRKAEKSSKLHKDITKKVNTFTSALFRCVTKLVTEDITIYLELPSHKEFVETLFKNNNIKEKKRMSAFKAYDIRGVWGKDFNEETVYKVGYFLPSLLKTDHVVVGRDVRVSSPIIHDTLLRGITDSGSDVWDLGLSTTPMVYFATTFLDSDASVQITASHNPAEYNGLKISRRGALPVGGETGLKDLERMVNEDKVEVSQKKGEVKDYSYVLGEYRKFFSPKAEGLEGLNITIDCSNGMSSLLIKDVLSSYGRNIKYIYDTLDGTFPNHEPNPLEEKNCKALEEEVRKNHSDVGVIYDGDADRVIFTDENGNWIQPDYITAVIGYYYMMQGRTGNALCDIRTSKSTTDYLTSLGWNVTIWKVGHAFAKLKIREIDGVYGGELAGHYYFKDFGNCDSGILASLIVLSVVKKLKDEGKTFSSLIKEIVRYSNSGETNFRLENKDDAIKALVDKYSKDASLVLDIDGYRIEYPDWWFNVRKSNTEPFLRIVLEAKTKEMMDEKMKEISSIIKSFN